MRRGRVQRDLIFDVGANEGQDTAFYLAKGFRVVAVEANPTLVEKLRQRFAAELADGTLVVVDRAVTDQPGPVRFYVNAANTHWSSLHEEWGRREGASAATEILVDTVTLAAMLTEHGCPYYLKIDVEGEDLALLHALAATRHRPTYVSVEENRVVAIDVLASMGYKRFALVNQQQHYLVSDPNPPREGRYVSGARHDGESSGLFGREVPEPWQRHLPFRSRYLAEVRNEAGEWMSTMPHAWFDIHARYRRWR